MAGTPREFIEETLDYSCHKNNPAVLLIKSNLNQKCNEIEKLLLLELNKLNQSWNSLSGGERQRCIIACSLVIISCYNEGNKCSAILLLDEPTAACDSETTLYVENALKLSNCSIIMITHDITQSERFCHRRVKLNV